jgi:hypothetical protein
MVPAAEFDREALELELGLLEELAAAEACDEAAGVAEFWTIVVGGVLVLKIQSVAGLCTCRAGSCGIPRDDNDSRGGLTNTQCQMTLVSCMCFKAYVTTATLCGVALLAGGAALLDAAGATDAGVAAGVAVDEAAGAVDVDDEADAAALVLADGDAEGAADEDPAVWSVSIQARSPYIYMLTC